MPPGRPRPDPLLAAPKGKKEPLKVSSSTTVDLLTELSLARQKFDADRQASSTAISRGRLQPTKVTPFPCYRVDWRKHYGERRIKVLIYGMHETNNMNRLMLWGQMSWRNRGGHWRERQLNMND